MLTAVWSCNRPSDMQREHPAVSPTFYADSLRTLGRGIRLIKEEKESLAFPRLIPCSGFRWTMCSLPRIAPFIFRISPPVNDILQSDDEL